MKRKLSSPFIGGSNQHGTITDKTKIFCLVPPDSTVDILKLTSRQKVFIAIIILLISLTAIVYYQYNKQGLDLIDVAAKPVSAEALLTEFNSNEQQANKKYLNKVLQVTGNVTEIKYGSANRRQVLLNANDPMSTIACTIENSKQEIKAGQTISVKGICTGFLNDVILTKCILIPMKK
jgi:hypothetical protein